MYFGSLGRDRELEAGKTNTKADYPELASSDAAE
jgi:hypothetical protein